MQHSTFGAVFFVRKKEGPMPSRPWPETLVRMRGRLFVFLLMGFVGLQAQTVDLNALEQAAQQASGYQRLVLLNELAENWLTQSAGRSLFFAEQATELATTLKDALEADPAAAGELPRLINQESLAYYHLGAAQEALGSRSKATRAYRKGVRLAAMTGNVRLQKRHQDALDRLGKGGVGLDVAITEWARERLEDLDEMVENAPEDREVKVTAGTLMSSTLEVMGRHAENNGRIVKAIDYYEKALPFLESEGDTARYVAMLRHVADLHTKQGNSALASQYYAMASGASSAAPKPESTPPKPVETEDLAEAEAAMRDIAREVEAESAATLEEEQRALQASDTYLARAENLARTGDYKASYENLMAYARYRELLHQLEQQKQQDSLAQIMINGQIQEINQLRLEQELQAAEMERASQFRNSLVISMILILAIAGLLTYLFFTKRQAHRQLSSAFDELADTHRQLQSTQAQLVSAEKMASLGQLTAGIAHEINNPVNFISGNLHPLREDVDDLIRLLEAYEQAVQAQGLGDQFAEAQRLREEMEVDFLTEEIRELLAGIGEGADRTTEIVRGLRTFARLDEGDRKQFDVHQGIDSTLALLRNRCEGIEILRDYGPLPEIEGYPGKLNQVFMNLLTNAIQAMPEGGLIQVLTRVKGEMVEIRIRDTGQGMTDEVKSRIFEPFYTTKEVGEGTGLGLSISHGIIEQHHGQIEVDSLPGHGTEVILRLPIHWPAEAQAHEATEVG